MIRASVFHKNTLLRPSNAKSSKRAEAIKRLSSPSVQRPENVESIFIRVISRRQGPTPRHLRARPPQAMYSPHIPSASVITSAHKLPGDQTTGSRRTHNICPLLHPSSDNSLPPIFFLHSSSHQEPQTLPPLSSKPRSEELQAELSEWVRRRKPTRRSHRPSCLASPALTRMPVCVCVSVFFFFFERTCNRVCVQVVLISLACVFS